MSRIDEITARLVEIRNSMDGENADIMALSTEADALIEERKKITAEAEQRRALREKVLDIPDTKIIERNEIHMEEKKTYAIDTPEYRAAWLANLQGKELTEEQRAAMTASAAIPTQTLNRIVEKLEQESPLYAHITVMEIPGNVTIPVESTINDANWLAMGTTATDAADALAPITLTAHKLIRTVSIGADVAAMAVDAFEDWLVTRLAKKMRQAVDKAILSGTDTNQPKGILTETFASGQKVTVAASASITYDNVMDLIAGVASGFAVNAKFVVSRKTLYGEIAKIKASTAGVPMFVMNSEDGFAGKIMGYPVIVDDHMPDGKVLFGDLSEYYWNWAKPVEITKDGSVEFRSGNECWRALALADGELVNKTAFALLEKASAT